MLKDYSSELFVGLLIVCVAFLVVGFEPETSSAGDERVCKPPRPPRNGSVTVWGHGMLVEYTCDHGLFPIGETFGSCNPISGRWSVRTPYCAWEVGSLNGIPNKISDVLAKREITSLINPFPNDKCLDDSNMKGDADDKIYYIDNGKFVCYNTENIETKRRKC